MVRSVNPPEGQYAASRRETIAEAPGLRVRRLVLEPGQCVPWHYHNNIAEQFFCMRGPMQVDTRSPDATHVLAPGETLAVPAGIAHTVGPAGDQECEFMSVQGVGPYDFVRVPD